MEDGAIVELYWRRDAGAVAETREKYGALLRALAGRFVSPEDAEECEADAYLRAWEAIPPERPASLRAYLAKIVRNLAIDRLRRQGADKRGGGEARAVLEELDAVAPDSAFGEASAKELGRAVSAFIRTLPRRDGDIFIRRCFYAEPVGDIARRFSVTPNAVSVCLARTRKKLSVYLKKEGFLE